MMNELWAVADGHLPLPRIDGLAALGPKKAKPNRVPVETPTGIAVVDVKGILTRDGSDWFSGSSYRGIAEAVTRLAADSSIRRIVLRIDSPGGTVQGVHEAADAIYRNRNKIEAVADGLCCSAAYWLASQARVVYASRGSQIGSIGTRMTMLDLSKLFEKAGIRVVSIATGERKDIGVPGKPITDENETYLRLLVADVHRAFHDDVMRARKLGQGQMKAAETAAVFTVEKAQGYGLIDGIQAFDDLLASFGPIVSQADKLAAQHAAHIRIPLARGQY